MARKLTLRPRLADGRTDWARVHGRFLRLAAVLWLAAGVLAWARIVGAVPDAGPVFVGAEAAERVRAGLFAIMYPVAAVGLWLGASWGVAIFVLSIVAQVALEIALGSPDAAAALTILANLAALGAWAAVFAKARRNPVIERR